NLGKAAMANAALHVGRVVVTVSVLLGKFAEGAEDLTLGTPITWLAFTEGLDVLVKNRECDVEDGALTSPPTQRVNDHFMLISHWPLGVRDRCASRGTVVLVHPVGGRMSLIIHRINEVVLNILGPLGFACTVNLGVPKLAEIDHIL